MRPARSATSSGPPGVIDSLTSGFDHVNRIPWIIAIPVLLDVFLWLGPRLSAAPALHQLIQGLGNFYANVATQTGDASTVEQARQALATADQAASGFNVLTLLTVSIAGVPSILPTSVGVMLARQISSSGTFLAVALGLELLGTLLGCLYLGLLAQEVRDGQVSLPSLGRRVWSYWLSVVGLVVLGIAGIVLISIPIGFALAIVGMLVPVAAAVLGQVLLLLGVLAGIYLFFVIDAIVVSQTGPVRAAVNSARVVANNFWSAVGFIVLESLIAQGMLVVWTAMSKNPAGMVVAILGNAYVMSGLAAASMQYYRARAARLPAASGVVGRVSQV